MLQQVTVFESGSGLGGVWRYDPRTESEDPLGQDPKRPRVHSSMYQHLRTNLPRDVMAFSDYPFHPSVMGSRSTDPRLFCSHNEVPGAAHKTSACAVTLCIKASVIQV